MDAHIVLPVSVQSASPFDSQVAAFALVEALITGVVNTLGDRAIARVSDYDTLWAAQGFTEPGIVG
jgi:DNA-binding MurR/RpiR family transcriptional regulator